MTVLADCANAWVELLHDWGWGIFIVALAFAFALEERGRSR